MSPIKKPSVLKVTTLECMIEKFFTSYASYFKGKGYKMDVFCANASKSKVIKESFCHTYDAGWKRKAYALRNFLEILTLRRLIKQNAYTIVHTHTPIASFITRLAIRTLPKKTRPFVIYSAHGFHFHKYGNKISNLLFKAIEKQAAKWTDALVLINETDFKAALGFGTIDPKNVHLFPGVGMDLKKFHMPENPSLFINKLKIALEIPKSSPYFLCIAELVKHKCIDQAIRALKILGRKDVHLLVAGKGKEEHTLKHLAKKLDLSKNVHFLGHINYIPTLLKGSHGLLFPSKREGLGVAILEAMALGVPVIASNANGPQALLSNNCGYLFEFGDIETLTKHMAHLLTNPKSLALIRKNAYRKTTAYSLENLLEKHLKLYDSFLIKTYA